MPMPTRILPNADALTAAYLRDGFGTDVTVSDVSTGDVYGRTPFVLVRAVGSGTVPHWQLLSTPVVDVECFAAPDKDAASDLAEACRVILFRAPLTQRVLPTGHISRVELVSYPAEVRVDGQPGGIFHYTATYRLWLRPPMT